MAFLAQTWDILLFVVLTVIHVASWAAFRGKSAEKDPQLRQFGETVMGSTSGAGITAVSILIPASLLVVQVGLGASPPQQIPADALDQVFRASLWFVLSLVCGLLVIWLVPMRGQKYNVARDFPVGALWGPQLVALLLGVVRLVVGLHETIYR